MKNMRKIFVASLCLLMGTTVAMAQVDVTSLYLQNAGFDIYYDYDIASTGNVSQEMLDVKEWTNDYTMDYTIVGTYQIGTQKTFNGADVPAKNVDGTAEGGVLAISTGWEESIKLYQKVSLPKGEYALVTAYYNGCSSTEATSLVGWIPSTGNTIMSKKNSFPAHQWVTDTLKFKLLTTREGKIQLGMKAIAGGSANSAKLSLDYIKLFSYKWDGSLLISSVEKATQLYGDGTANGADKLREALDVANTVMNDSTATPDEQVSATAQLNRAIITYEKLLGAYTALQKAIDEAITQLGDYTGYGASELQAAIDEAKQAIADVEATVESLTDATETLNIAVEVYNSIAAAHIVLHTAINEATALLGDATGNGATELQIAIEKAEQTASTEGVTSAEVQDATKALEQAMFCYRLANATGAVPSVSTHKYVARGSTVALGRSTVSGSNLQEQGFCWSTSPEPTVLDHRSTKYYSQNGRIYAMEGLEPSTIYYVRAYAMTKEYAVGYGDIVKIITLPRGNVTWGYDNGADATTNARISAAVADAVDYLNTFTSINGLYANVHYGSGTPTADCSYGGWMRVGPNASYQRTGTILHELGHAIGVGTHSVWYDGSSPMRAGSGRGDWLGDRATAVVRFLDNSTTSVLTGDGTHMWPYGVNGAHEDTGDPMLYISNALIYQALGEDGLPPTSGFSTPHYAFEQEDTIKYYIKNENENRGFYDSYIMEDTKGHLVWKRLSAEQALNNDSVAWYITFDPKKAYYQLRNAATGHYITYAGTGTNGIRTSHKEVGGTNENFHLMRSRADIKLGSGDVQMNVRGYWLIHPEHKQNPTCLVASDNGAVSTATFSLSNTATVQRWLLLPAHEVGMFESAAVGSFMEELDDMAQRIKTLVSVPHSEDVEGTDATINAVISELENVQGQTLSINEIAALLAYAEEALMDFLANATPSSAEQPFDLTYMVANASIDDASGWSASPTLSYSCMEYYQATFDFNQTIKSLPAGTYQVRVQAFQRPGSSTDSYNAYVGGKNNVTTLLYANATTQKIQHIASEAQTIPLGGAESTVGSPTKYIPNNMEAASIYFKNGLYDNAVTTELSTEKGSLKIGLRCSSSSDYYWSIFDNFRLYYYGTMDKDIVSGIEPVVCPMQTEAVYSITGVRVRPDATNLNDLPAGIYIIGGRKVSVK